MKLGDKVTFDRYYRKSEIFIDHENLTEEQEKELEETEGVIFNRLDIVDLNKPVTGIVAGKRRMVKTTTFGYDDFSFGVLFNDYADVYLVAVTMSGFYRVPAEWLEVSK